MNKKKGKIFILSGPSGSGKTTLYQRLLRSPRLKRKIVKTVSVTTRLPRPGEKHARDYYFISKKLFLHKRGAGQFLESQRVFDNYYGTPVRTVKSILRQGKNVLLCIDVKGAKVVLRKCPGAVSIFVKTRSLAELRRRLQSRGSEDPGRIRLRLDTAKEELRQGASYKYTVINDEIPQAQDELERIILSEIEAR